MLLLVAYVHSCRTPISMDMAIAYWRKRINEYEEIYKMFREAGQLIIEYEGDLSLEPQDHFTARSILAAESIFQAANNEQIKIMLNYFYSNISPSRICHYDIFKRRAYDYKIISRAFSNWQEGNTFYERIFQLTPDAYVRQHHALYLSDNGKYSEAFIIIDEALSMSPRFNWSIQNSHAIILFRANIQFTQDDKAKKQLDRSMEILKKCYKSDRRKAFHAMVFADHALKYEKGFHDEKSKEYLELAEKWLTEQKEEEYWWLEIPRLLRIVERRLTQLQ